MEENKEIKVEETNKVVEKKKIEQQFKYKLIKERIIYEEVLLFRD